MLLFFVKEFEKSSFTKSLWCNSTNHACPNNSQTQLENMDKQKFVECYISNSQYNIWCPIYDFFGQTFELTPPQHFKKGTFYITEDSHISNCLMNKTIRSRRYIEHFQEPKRTCDSRRKDLGTGYYLVSGLDLIRSRDRLEHQLVPNVHPCFFL